MHPLFKKWTKDKQALTNFTVPYHSGAVQFYKDVELWTPSMTRAPKRFAVRTGERKRWDRSATIISPALSSWMKSCFPKKPPATRALKGTACPRQSRLAHSDSRPGSHLSARRAAADRLAHFRRAVHGVVLGADPYAPRFSPFPKELRAIADRVPWYDLLAALGGLAVGLYIFINYPSLVNSLGEIHTDRVIMGCVAVVLLAEACRRLTGWSLVIIAGDFSCSTLFSLISFPGLLWPRLVGAAGSRLISISIAMASSANPWKSPPASSWYLFLFGNVLYAVGGAAFLDRFFSFFDGPLPRRAGQDGDRLVELVRHDQRQRRRQCRRRRHDDDSDDEKIRLPASGRRRRRSHGLDRRPDHAAGHGRGGFSHRRVSSDALLRSRAASAGAGSLVLCRAFRAGRSAGRPARLARCSAATNCPSLAPSCGARPVSWCRLTVLITFLFFIPKSRRLPVCWRWPLLRGRLLTPGIKLGSARSSTSSPIPGAACSISRLSPDSPASSSACLRSRVSISP